VVSAQSLALLKPPTPWKLVKHLHVSVDDPAQSIQFYSTLFAALSAVTKPDYAKWMLEGPRVNFAISTRYGETGLDHLGVQVETPGELHEVYGRLQQADRSVLEEGATTCCCAQSERSWITDPRGLSWEIFLTSGNSTVYGDSVDSASRFLWRFPLPRWIACRLRGKSKLSTASALMPKESKHHE
jgi:hypothetical protein